MFERTQSFDMKGKIHKGIHVKIENILHNEMEFSTNTLRLGESLLRITYFDEKINKEKQKNNRITILQEPEKRIYIQVKGQLTDNQVEQIWRELEKDLNISEINEKENENLPTKDEIIENIIESIKLKGYSINTNDAHHFIESFQEKYDRLPLNDEIESIVKGYLIMMNEDYLLKKTETSIKDDRVLEHNVPFIESNEIEIETESNSYNSSVLVVGNSTGRRQCPSCGDQASIHEVSDKSLVLMDYPRIYGKKKYCGNCGYEWK